MEKRPSAIASIGANDRRGEASSGMTFEARFPVPRYGARPTRGQEVGTSWATPSVIELLGGETFGPSADRDKQI